MSKRDKNIILQHMLDHATEAVDLVQKKKRADLDSDRLLSLAIVRLLEIMGEAATRMPKEESALCPQIPWSQITGMRNRLIHGYDAVDFDIVWQILKDDLPKLITELEMLTQ